VTAARDRKTLLDQPPQTAPSKTAKPAVNGDNSRCFIADRFDFRIGELERTATRFTNLPIKIELGFVRETGVDPPVVEPNDLEVSSTVIDQAIDDNSAPWQSAHSNARDPPSEQDPRASLDGLIQTGDTGPVLVPTGQVKQEIEDCVETLGGQRLCAFRTDTFEFCQRISGKQFGPVRRQLSSISKRHWIVPKTTASPLTTGTKRPATRRTPLTKVPFIVPTSSMTP